MRTLFVASLLLVPGHLSAQRGGCVDQPARGSEILVAAESEPGERLTLRGRALRADGTPAAGIRVRVYHTDAEGYYSPAGVDEQDARLCGVLETAADGSYRIDTILPAPYPTGGPRAHVHLHLTRPDGERRLHTVMWREAPSGTDPATGDRTARTRPLVRDAKGRWQLVYDLGLP